MKTNIGSTDKIIRLVLGVLIGGLGYYYHAWWGLLAIIPIATALINFCPLYAIVGMNTCEVPKK